MREWKLTPLGQYTNANICQTVIFFTFFRTNFLYYIKDQEKAQILLFKFVNEVIHLPRKTTILFMQRKLKKRGAPLMQEIFI